MIIKIGNLELIIKSFSVKYTDDFNEVTFTYKTEDQSVITKLKKSLKDKIKLTILNETYSNACITFNEIKTTTKSNITTFKLKLKY